MLLRFPHRRSRLICLYSLGFVQSFKVLQHLGLYYLLRLFYSLHRIFLFVNFIFILFLLYRYAMVFIGCDVFMEYIIIIVLATILMTKRIIMKNIKGLGDVFYYI